MNERDDKNHDADPGSIIGYLLIVSILIGIFFLASLFGRPEVSHGTCEGDFSPICQQP